MYFNPYEAQLMMEERVKDALLEAEQERMLSPRTGIRSKIGEPYRQYPRRVPRFNLVLGIMRLSRGGGK